MGLIACSRGFSVVLVVVNQGRLGEKQLRYGFAQGLTLSNGDILKFNGDCHSACQVPHGRVTGDLRCLPYIVLSAS